MPGKDTAPDRLPRLLEAILDVGTELDLGPTLQHVVDSATRLAHARYGALGVLSPSEDAVHAVYTCGVAPGEGEGADVRPESRSGLPGGLVREPAVLRLDDIIEDPRAAAAPAGGTPARSFLGATVRVEDEVFGTLFLSEKEGGGAFDAEDEQLLRVLAAQAGIAIGNARLYEAARQRERWIEGAAAVTTTLLTSQERTDALRTVAEQARILADAAAGVILLPTGDGGMEIATVSGSAELGDASGFVGTGIDRGSPVLDQLLGGEAVFIEDSATDPRMTTPVRTRFGPSMMLPLQAEGQLIGTLALPRVRGGRPYSRVDRRLAAQFTSQAALALVLADARQSRERLAVFEDRDRIARDLHDLVVQRLFATGMMLESTRRRAAPEEADTVGATLGRAAEELQSTVQEVRTAIFTLQQPPAQAPTTFRGRVLRETAGAAAVLGFPPSVHFTGPVDARLTEEPTEALLAALRRALAAAVRRPGLTRLDVQVDATATLPDGTPAARLTVTDDGTRRPEEPTSEGGGTGTRVVWEIAL
ncbi:GAF domain-containing sensor histidine kinase [Streptomyces sp. NPDC058045]|uniref:sensor histidine kinase n=1 Tax=Streptomyces sp. NPDC058045 TaxID=3346311 RepID=UPI0036E5B9D4